MNDDIKIREQLVIFAQRAYQRRLVHGTGGNLSARLHNDKMIITASGLSLVDTERENLMTVDINSYDWDPNRIFIPSKEYKFHADIYRIRPEIGAILHVHPPFATAFAVKGQDIPRLTDAGYKLSAIPIVPFAPGGSEELKDLIVAAVRQDPNCIVLLLEKHGIVALGSDIVTAYNLADLTESLAHIAYITLGINS
jgi:L-fuculose-phosphate aldolase